MIQALPVVLLGAVIGTVTLDEDVPAGDEDYLLLDFDVPLGTKEIRIAHTDGSGDNILDWGVFAPDGFRGYGGGLEDDAVIGELASSRGYLTGPITPGTWQVLVGKAKINAPPGHYAITITFHDAPTLPPQTVSDPMPPTLETGARWYAGDLHVHSEQSGDAGATFQEIYDLARSVGLDFVVLSDHNTQSQHYLVPAFQAGVTDLLFVRGDEITTYGGHAGGVGVTGFVDWRVGLGGLTIEEVAGEVKGQGGFFVVNHPALDIGDACIGCGWSYDGEAIWGLVGGIEIQTGKFDVTGAIFTPRAIELWEQQLAAGRRVVAVGGSDDHQAGEDMGAFAGRIGSPTTLVYADELSEPALLAGLKAGRVVVKLRGHDDPDLELFASDGEGGEVMVGDTLAASRVFLRAHVVGGNGAAVAITRNGEFVEQRPIDSDDFSATFELPVSAGGDRFRASVYADGADVVITNHIYVTYSPSGGDDEGGGCGCRAGGRGRGGAGALAWLACVALAALALACFRRG